MDMEELFVTRLELEGATVHFTGVLKFHGSFEIMGVLRSHGSFKIMGVFEITGVMRNNKNCG